MAYRNPELKIIEARRLLARSGEEILPRSAYDQLIKDGFLDKPIAREGRQPRHLMSQIDRCTRALAARAEKPLPMLGKLSERSRKTMDEKIAAKFA